MASSPTNLVSDEILTTHNIYRTAKVENGVKDLYTARPNDDFPEVFRNSIDSKSGYISNCAKSLIQQDELSSDQWPSLTTWHAGLSCQIFFKHPQQSIVIDVFGNDFKHQFDSAKSNIKDVTTKIKYQQFLCYELVRGTPIPNGVGIEKHGENHVCLYPICDRNAVSDISPGDATFAIDALKDLVPSWRPFALLKFKANGYPWPDSLPKDQSLFPIRRWVESVILTGEAELAVSVGYCTEDFVNGNLDWPSYFRHLLSIGSRFGLMCSYQDCIINSSLMKALRYALSFNELQLNNKQSFMLKSKTFVETPSVEQHLVESHFCDFHRSSRQEIDVIGGNVFVTATASIDILYLDSVLTGSCDRLKLPFTINIENQLIVFDEVDCSPVFESNDNDNDSLSTTITPSYSGSTNPSDRIADVSVVIEVDELKAFEVKIPSPTLTSVLSQCTTCFGYTLRGLRCKYLRKPLGRRNGPVWCHHHQNQEQEFKSFLVSWKRPNGCIWWEQYVYEEMVLMGRKLSI